MELNENKSKIIEMKKNGEGNVMKIGEYGNIDFVSEYKYLGVVVTEKGYGKISIAKIRDRALKTIVKLSGALSQCNALPKFRLDLFDKTFKPIACYGSEILGQCMWSE